jgi:hypothetical protein
VSAKWDVSIWSEHKQAFAGITVDLHLIGMPAHSLINANEAGELPWNRRFSYLELCRKVEGEMNRRLSATGLQCNVYPTRKGGMPSVYLDTDVAGSQVSVRVEVVIGNGEVTLRILRLRGKKKIFEHWLATAVERAAIQPVNEQGRFSAVLFDNEADPVAISDRFYAILSDLLDF